MKYVVNAVIFVKNKRNSPKTDEIREKRTINRRWRREIREKRMKFDKNVWNSTKTGEIRKKRVKFDKNKTQGAHSGIKWNNH